MADGGNIKQRLTLEGAENIPAQLARIGQAGEAMGASLKAAAAQISSGLNSAFAPLRAIGGEIAAFTGRLANIGSALGVGGGLAGLAGLGSLTGFGAFIKSSADDVKQIGGLAKQAGTSIEDFSSIQLAMAETGASTDTLGTAFRRLAVRVEEEWDNIKKSVRDAAEQIIRDQLNIEASALGLEAAQNQLKKVRQDAANGALTLAQAEHSLAQAEHNVAQAQENLNKFPLQIAREKIADLLGIRGAVQSLAEAEERLRVAQGGERDPEFEKQLEVNRLSLEVEEKREKLKQAREQKDEHERTARAREEQLQLAVEGAQLQAAQSKVALEQQQRQVAESGLRTRQAQLAVEQAQLDLRAKQKKAAEDEFNSVDNLAKRVNEIAEKGRSSEAQGGGAIAQPTSTQAIGGVNIIRGPTGIGGALPTSAQTAATSLSVDQMVTGIVRSIGPGVHALGELKGGFDDISQVGPTLRPVLLKLADVFKGTGDAALNMAVSVKLFGREAGPTMLKALSPGSDALLKRSEEIRKAGLALTEDEKKSADDFVRSANSTSATFGRILDKIGVKFAPGATTALDTIREGVVKNLDLIERSAERLPATLSAIGSPVAAIVSQAFQSLGGGPAVAGALQSAFDAIPDRIKQAMAGVPAAVADIWNALKSDASAAVEGIATWFQSLPEKIGAALSSLGESLGKVWDDITTGVKATVERIVEWFRSLPEKISSALSGVIEAMVAPFRAAVSQILALVETVLQKLRELRSERESAASSGSAPGGEVGSAGLGSAGSGGAGGGGRGFASGGRPPVGVPSVVGERGIETFIPDTAGTILPHGLTQSLLAAGRSLGDAMASVADRMASVAVPSFAPGMAMAGAGAAAGYMRIDLVLPNGNEINELMAPSSAVDQLQREATLRKLASGGPAPSRVR